MLFQTSVILLISELEGKYAGFVGFSSTKTKLVIIFGL